MLLKSIFQKNTKLTPDKKEWLEQSFLWLVEKYGTTTFFKQSIIQFNESHFPEYFERESVSIEDLLVNLKSRLGLDDTFITLEPSANSSTTTSISTVDNQFHYTISLPESHLQNTQVSIAHTCLELLKIKLISENLEFGDDSSSPLLLFLGAAFFGFGPFIANALIDPNQSNTFKEFPTQTIAYILAIISVARKDDPEHIDPLLPPDIRHDFKTFSGEIITSSTNITPNQLLHCNEIFRVQQDSITFIQNGNYALALTLCSDFLQRHPNNLEIILTKGYAETQTNAFDKALTTYHSALNLNSENTDIFCHLAFIHLKKNNLDKADTWLQKAEDHQPNNPLLLRNRGIYHSAKGDINKAFYFFEKTLRINPGLELTHYYFAMAHLENGNKKRAIDLLEISVNLGELRGKALLEKLKQ